MQSFQLLNGFFIRLMATNLLPTYSGRVVGCCIGLSMVPLGKGLFQSARHTVPNEPSPTALMTVKSRGPSRIREAAVVGMSVAAPRCADGGALMGIPAPLLLACTLGAASCAGCWRTVTLDDPDADAE